MPIFQVDFARRQAALYDPGVGGDPDDMNSAFNTPLRDPINNLDKVYFHSALDNLEKIWDRQVTISHPLSKKKGYKTSAAPEFIGDGKCKYNQEISKPITTGLYPEDYLLLKHGQVGVIPHVFIVLS